ncbi:hypothetical protein RGCCGE502_22710 [Rhizobium grahamii CCGE 502]|uniref:Uncharacterized protein n=2 Tax=Rhizobium grahamii TaxID=1120045 RepID=S3HBV8_9HYPH|nr:hypothetical protein RGCCGE502_22710 [Rhizobium grahamii CCGE 502]
MFWRLTLREISVIIAGVTNRKNRERDERMSLAWHIEALARQKKLPKLETMMTGANKSTGKQMSAEQMEAVTRSWMASRHRKK